MRYIKLLLISHCIFTPAFAQSSSHAPQATGSRSTHGLVLSLSRDERPEPPNSGDLNTCLAHNPPLACVPLVFTLKNEGKEAILSYSATCGWTPFTVDLKKQDGSWEPFPRQREATGIVCESTVAGYSVIWPGRSYTFRARLADPLLGLDTALPGTPPYAPSEPSLRGGTKGYSFLMGTDPHIVIRAHRSVGGCIASDQVAEGETFDVGDPLLPSKCSSSEWLSQPVNLQSNDLQLTDGPASR